MRRDFEQIAGALAERRDELIDDLRRHVSICTGGGHGAGLDRYRAIVVGRLEQLGCETEVIEGEVVPGWVTGGVTGLGEASGESAPPTVVCRRDEPSEPRILIAGHLDTVFGPNDPFQSMDVSGDGVRAVGPGVVDMKGGILIALGALEALAQVGLDVAWTFILNSDEERGSYASEQALRREAARHHWGLALEPALPDGSLAVERKGSGQFMIEARGVASHAGREFEKGASAVYALARALVEVQGFTDLDRGVTVNVGPVEGGTATNVVPDRARAWGNARFPTKPDAEALVSRLESLAGENGDGTSIAIRHSFNRPAKPLIPETKLLADRAARIASELGQELPFSHTGGVCDGNILQDAGLATIDTLGVRGGGLHTREEWIELDSLVERAALLACLILELSELD